jgi:hypothetical protein
MTYFRSKLAVIVLGYFWVIPVVRLGSEQKRCIFFRPTSNTKFRKNNIVKIVADNFNRALKVANPASKDDINKWGCKYPKVPTNSHG